MEDGSAIVVAFITGVLGPVLVMVAKYFIDKRSKKKDPVTDACEASQSVVTKIDEIKQEYNADRVWIAQFHNGGHFYPTGKSIAKFSVFYETVGVGISSIQSNLQNIPVPLFSKSINYLLKDEMIGIADFKDESIATYGLKYFAEENGTKSQYLFAIRSIDGKFIGILSIDFTKKKTKLSDQDVIELEIAAGTLGGVLMSHLTR